MAGVHALPAEGWILYDASCGVCSRWVPRWRSALERLGLGIAPLQADWVRGHIPGTDVDLLRDVRLLRRDGTTLSGADVYRYIASRIWWMYPLYLLARAPVVSALVDRAYRVFADHRHAISASCGVSPE
ncbi:MAG TPA: DCC1-like thiol-disulfide oxidoreductase family protein [Candidatus Methylomirabilis sp.]|nr:DCC1-like thiol-disulfide oxidoreductase family protein [Gemmatimonadaceae bacterium]HYB41069.1 DCC1-like thiol-disulfide oxidoreductase family protein [Candidatus Methylomirabilis sp.]